MKRVIEKGNLAFNHMTNICDLCKRYNGFREDNDDEYDCKYNKDNKRLYNGLTKDNMQNFKCKYYKRHQKFITCRLEFKRVKSYTKDKITIVKYKKGKFKENIEYKENKHE